MDFETITLSNGVKVSNFGSPHPFNFTDGSILPAASKEQSEATMLKPKEIEVAKWNSQNGTGVVVTDIDMGFEMSDECRAVAFKAIDFAKENDVDVVLVPLPFILSWKAEGHDVGPFRCIRVADRITKAIHIDRFCV